MMGCIKDEGRLCEICNTQAESEAGIVKKAGDIKSVGKLK
jgi:hypothetical protein